MRRRLQTLSAVALVLPLTLLLFLENGGLTLSSRGRDKDLGTYLQPNRNSTIGDGFCSLKNESSTPSRWWVTHFDEILAASQHVQDANYAYKNWTHSLLASFTPDMLQQGVKARPSSSSVQHVADKLFKKIRDPHNHSPLQVMVVGGSVTRGHGCNESPLMDEAIRFHPTLCAWPSRLEYLLNTLARVKIVDVYNVAVGATNLQFATPLMKYHLYPEELLANGGPDIIISSYATNEQASAVEDTTSVEWRNKKRENLQEFIKACRKACPCHKPAPLVVFVDDYLGNRQDYVMREMSYKGVVTEVAEWYNAVMHVSYADVVRKHVYADTSDTTFTPPWLVDNITNTSKVAVHFGMGGHLAVAWSILYSMIDMMSLHCDNEAFVERIQVEGHKGVFDERVQNVVREIPPPELRPDLTLQNVSREWQDTVIQMRKDELKCSDKEAQCAFAFLAGPASTVRSPEEIDAYLQPFLIRNEGWEPVVSISDDGYVKKLGLEARKRSARMALQLVDIQQDVRVINVQHIKSYGTKWADSKARFTVRVESPDDQSYTCKFEIDGYHEHQTR